MRTHTRARTHTTTSACMRTLYTHTRARTHHNHPWTEQAIAWPRSARRPPLRSPSSTGTAHGHDPRGLAGKPAALRPVARRGQRSGPVAALETDEGARAAVRVTGHAESPRPTSRPD